MGVKEIVYGKEAQLGILRGVELMAKAVGATLGPRGQNVIIEKQGLAPTITFDGVTVSKEMGLEDTWADIGVRLCKEVSSKTNEASGDGTTTATLLAYGLLASALKEIISGQDPIVVRKGIQAASDLILYYLDEEAQEISTYDDVRAVAEIACESSEMAKIVADAMSEVGRDGIISVEEGKKIETELETTSGMELGQTGYEYSEFVNTEDACCVLEDPVIACFDGVLDSPMVIANLLNDCLENERRSILFIADAFGHDVKATLLQNLAELRSRIGGFDYCAIKSPMVGRKRKDILEDIAILTGAEVCSRGKADNPLDWRVENCGSCLKVVARKHKVDIIGGDGSDEAIEKRVAQLRYEISTSPSEYDRQKLQERLGKLVGGITVIRVGAHTETEMREKKRRMEDALSATRASIDEGIVPGGGAALFHAAQMLPDVVDEVVENSLQPGFRAVRDACNLPLRRLCENSGFEPGSILGKLAEKPTTYGFDVKSGEFRDFMECDILDPKKVTRSAWENAVSFATTVLMTAVAVSEKDREAAELEAREI